MGFHPETKFDHPICDSCYFMQNAHVTKQGWTIEPAPRHADAAKQWESCCFCGNMTFSGIYIRRDPFKMDTEHCNVVG